MLNRTDSGNLISHAFVSQSALKILSVQEPQYYRKGNKAAVGAVLSGNIYLARQSFFRFLTIMCVSKIQIRCRDKFGSL